MTDFIAAYDDITTELADAQQVLAKTDVAYKTAGDARSVASARVQHLTEAQTMLANLEEVQPVLAKRQQDAAQAAITMATTAPVA